MMLLQTYFSNANNEKDVPSNIPNTTSGKDHSSADSSTPEPPEAAIDGWIKPKPVVFRQDSRRPEGDCANPRMHAYRLADLVRFGTADGVSTNERRYFGGLAPFSCYKQNFRQSLGACYAYNAKDNRLNQLDVLSRCVVAQSIDLFGPRADQDAHEFSAEELQKIAAKTEEIRKCAKDAQNFAGKKAIVHVRTGDIINDWPMTVEQCLAEWTPQQHGGPSVYCYVYPRSEFEQKMRWPESLEEIGSVLLRCSSLIFLQCSSHSQCSSQRVCSFSSAVVSVSSFVPWYLFALKCENPPPRRFGGRKTPLHGGPGLFDHSPTVSLVLISNPNHVTQPPGRDPKESIDYLERVRGIIQGVRPSANVGLFFLRSASC